MKRKFENIAIILFLSTLVVAVLTILFIRQNMSDTLRADSLEKTRDIATYYGSRMISLIGLLTLLSLFFLVLLFNSMKTIKAGKSLREKIEQEQAEIESKKEQDTEIVKNIKVIEKQKFDNVKEQILNLNEKLNLETYCNEVLVAISKEYELFQALFYTLEKNQEDNKVLKISGSYAFNRTIEHTLKLGEGLAGQVAKARRTVNIKQIPAGYIKAISGLGELTPSNLLISPVLKEDETIAVLELATFKEFSKDEEMYFESLGEILSQKIALIS